MLLMLTGAALLNASELTVQTKQDLEELDQSVTSLILKKCETGVVDNLQDALPTGLTSLLLNNLTFEDSETALAAVAERCAALNKLGMLGCRVDAPILTSIGGFRDLTDVSFAGCEFEKAITAPGWARGTQLHTLMLGYCQIDERSLVTAASASSLRRISLELLKSRSSVTDGVIKRMCERARKLERVSIQFGPGLTDITLKHLGTLPELRELKLPPDARITDSECRALSALTALKVLDVSGCRWISETGVSHAPGIDTLSIIGTGHYSMERFAGLLDGLKVLDVRNSGYTDEQLAHLGAVKSLNTLDVSGCKALTGEFLAELSSCDLTTLKLNRCDALKAKSMEYIASIAGLEVLELDLFDDVADADITSLERLKDLKVLSLDLCTQLNSKQFVWLYTNLSGLEELSIVGCSQLDRSDVKAAKAVLGDRLRTTNLPPAK